MAKRIRNLLIGLFGLAWASVAAATAPAPAPTLIQKLEALASRGNAEARYHLGMVYNNGIGTEKDPARAFGYFKEAAEAGDPLGAYKLGCYYEGQFAGLVPRDEALALKYKLVAAEAGYSLAQDDVATLYLRKSDYAHALPWLSAAGRQGNAHALYNLSALYKDGLGVQKSLWQSAAFFRLAHLAAYGRVNPNAQKSLDEMEAQLSASDRERAGSTVANWVTGPTPLTRQALQGLERAELLVAAP